MPHYLVEIVIAVGCVLLLGAYHLRLLKRLRTQPETTVMGRHRLTRASFLKLAERGEHEILVVQAMRNLIMSASFLASTAVLLAAGFLGGAFSADRLTDFVNSLNFLGVETRTLWLVKALLLTVNFLAAFFNFSLAIRSFNHVGMMVHVATDRKRGDDEKAPSGSEAVAEEIENGALYYALGMRGFYLAIPLTLWLFGPAWMLVGSVLLVIVLSRVD
jgi:uncharacterized membrane protein